MNRVHADRGSTYQFFEVDVPEREHAERSIRGHSVHMNPFLAIEPRFKTTQVHERRYLATHASVACAQKTI